MQSVFEADPPGDIFDRSAIHTTAAWVVFSELRRYPLRWSTTGKKADEDVWHFVHALIRQFMAYGYATWRNSRGQLQTVDNAVITRAKTSVKWKVAQLPGSNMSTRGWHVRAFVHPPVWITDPTYWDWPSPLKKSLPHLKVVEDMHENWMSRDAHNSRPATFTRIELQGHLQNQDGTGTVHLPVYRNLQTSAGASLQPNATTFQALIDNRHDAIRKLSEKSTLEREAIMSGSESTPLDRIGKISEPPSEMLHEEHVVTDGKSFSECKTLLSTSDGRFHYDRARHNVYNSLGIPPQATGETVNSERTASAAATFDTAMSHFLSTVRMYRDAVTSVLRDATMLPDGSHISFGTGLSSIQLERVMPYLKPNKAKRLLSQVYELEESYFDEERILDATMAKRPAAGKGPQQELNTVSANKTQSKRYKDTE